MTSKKEQEIEEPMHNISENSQQMILYLLLTIYSNCQTHAVRCSCGVVCHACVVKLSSSWHVPAPHSKTVAAITYRLTIL